MRLWLSWLAYVVVAAGGMWFSYRQGIQEGRDQMRDELEEEP